MGAIRDLNILYVMRGYPEKLIACWCKNNIQERWDKRFTSKTNECDESVLVLKSRFDDVWNFFSAAELGKTITEYWDKWLTRASDGSYSADPSRPFLLFDPDEKHDLVDVMPKLHCTVLAQNGEEVYSPDLCKIGLLGSCWIVSRRHTKNLLDLAYKWKNVVFEKLDEAIVADITAPKIQPKNVMKDEWARLFSSSTRDSEMTLNIHLCNSDDELEHLEFGRLSKMYT